MARAIVVRPKQRRANAEINITPFVDVMLVLLIIFMVAAPMMQQGIDVDLPETSTQALRVQDNPLILSVKKDGTYFLGRSEIKIEELVSKLTAIFEARASKEIYLRADRAAPYGTVVKAMAAAREAGSDQLGIVTEPET
ncbi:MAG: biopolymer transport protein TolR [Myxococcota bacterium]